MQLPLIPQNEEHRLNALKSYQILDTLSGQEYDDITQIASQLCETPISLITLLDEKRQWFKSKHGLDVSETPREIAFCSHAINEPDNIFEVEDALEDNRFYDNPLVVGNPNIRFYAGAPLITSNGEALGTLCVIDTKPRKLTTIQRKTLLNLAKQVMAQLELRKKNKELSVLLQKTKALKEKFENLSLVVSKTHVGVIITNAKGEIEHTNAAFGALSGYRIEEVIGETPGSFLYGKDTNLRHIQKMQEGLKSQQPFDQEILNYKKTGEPYWSSCSISPVFDDDGALISYVAVEQDITAQKENEAALIQAKEEAIAGVLVKDQFLSNMSHEIRTPMNGIIGISNILLKDADFTEKSRELIVHLNGAAHHLLTIINDILDLSKINAEKLTFERINFDFHKIFETLHYSLGLKAKEGGIDFVIKIDPEIPLILSGDPTRFNQILLNLTSNAIKFTERGKVEVSARLLEINEEGPKIIFKVIDTGIGIGKDKIGEVFEQFTQSNLTISRKYGGTGLGLCISKRLIEMHKGRIKVESELGKGSVFT
ncbi:MAG: PAS domain S-box-containing protein, partial [Saprospiraceae bacterium]